MGKQKKKGQSGEATSFLSRTQAQRKLQLSLADFRRLCILKGIYPHVPHKKKVVNRGNSANKTFYYVKDIQFLAHEPILFKFRDFKAFMKKFRRAVHRDDDDTTRRLDAVRRQPFYTLDHIVKERYPTFVDALRDLDDALSMIFLFAVLPHNDLIKAGIPEECRSLSVEFMHYVIIMRTLKKVFVSIRGVYFQAEIQSQPITWIVPHQFCPIIPSTVDLRIMLTFLEFYRTLLGFVNFKLYHSVGIRYPPQLRRQTEVTSTGESDHFFSKKDWTTERVASLAHSLVQTHQSSVEEPDEIIDTEGVSSGQEEAAKEEAKKKLFEKCKFFLGREVPRDVLVFTIRAFGGEVSWFSEDGVGASYAEGDETITHQVVDRPVQSHTYLSRCYVQPQWIFDSVNQGRHVLIDDYAPGGLLPPHLSPFDETFFESIQSAEAEAEKDVPSQPTDAEKKAVDESKDLAIMMMSRKKKKLYKRITTSKKRKQSEVRKLEQKRKLLTEKTRTST
ncbi:pescadillo homolog [Oscarella lobularis]|uniref:pescadillo homolog n=1 Tax=Oscarella lobularis TaxID=121494 RepID=UPI0033142F79